MSGHTPGPWNYEQADSCCLKGPIDFFIRIYAEDPGPENDFTIGLVRDADGPTRKANARLVAAAPELLEALKEALVYVKGRYECAFPDEQENESVEARVIAAIAKAEPKAKGERNV